ncbi:MAG: hemolysin family protein [Thermoplasmatota archaeon]
MIRIIGSILVITILIFISAFFSSSEMAFISVNKALIIDKARNGNKKAKILEKLYSNYYTTISAIVAGNNLVNIFASVLSGYVAVEFFGNIGVGVATAVMFFLVIIFSEATPKAFGLKNEKLLLRMARPLYLNTKLFSPFVIMLNAITNAFLLLIGEEQKKNMTITEEEIKAMMRLGVEEGTIEKDEREMVDDVFEFDETVVDELDQPKYKIEFLYYKDTIGDLIKKSIKTGYSRFPVYRKNFDDIIGMVHVKDTFMIKDHSTPVNKIMRKILKIKATMKADDVFREMKKHKTHLALLQDKKGRTLGLVSMEDLIEEIFGEISDEHDYKSA